MLAMRSSSEHAASRAGRTGSTTLFSGAPPNSRMRYQIRIKRLEHIVIDPEAECALNEIIAHQGGNDDDVRLVHEIERVHLFEYGKAVHFRHHHVEQQHVDRLFAHDFQCACAVFGNADQLQVVLSIQKRLQLFSHERVVICCEYSDPIHRDSSFFHHRGSRHDNTKIHKQYDRIAAEHPLCSPLNAFILRQKFHLVN